MQVFHCQHFLKPKKSHCIRKRTKIKPYKMHTQERILAASFKSFLKIVAILTNFYYKQNQICM